MAFWGKSFVFNDVPCDDFDLMLYDVGSTTQSTGNFASTVSVVEETLPSRWKPYLYGVKYDKKLEFTIVFGVNERRLDREKFLDRYELENIAYWLTGHEKYLWLEVEQDDLDYVRYRCIISGLEIVEYGNIPWALKATVTCDSPYAYMYPQAYEYKINGTSSKPQIISFYNESGHNGLYMPKVEIEQKGGTFSITNVTDNNRKFEFKNVPTSVTKISVDNDLGIISNNQSLNLYPYFNFRFFRLVKGENILKIVGNGTLRLICEFPANVGG